MLMSRGKTKHITKQGYLLLGVLRNARKVAQDYTAEADKDNKAAGYAGFLNPIPEGWLTRHMIAWAFGKKKLTHHDLAQLDLLAEQGLIEINSSPIGRDFGYMYEYRAKESASSQ